MNNKTYSDGEFVKEYIEATVKKIFPESKLKNVLLLRRTIEWSVDSISSSLAYKLASKLK